MRIDADEHRSKPISSYVASEYRGSNHGAQCMDKSSILSENRPAVAANKYRQISQHLAASAK